MTCNCGLSLERWREIMGYHPLSFWQWQDTYVSAQQGRNPNGSACNPLVREYAWQNIQALGRADIRQAIDTAITRLTEYLDYSPYPAYREDKIAITPDMWGYGYGGRCLRLRTEKGKIIKLGVEKRELVETVETSEGEVITEIFGYDIPNTFTVAFQDDPDLDLDELILVVNNADRYPVASNRDSLDCKWIRGYDRVERKTQAPISGTSIVFTGRAWLMAKPEKYESLTLNPADAALKITETANLLSQIDVVRQYTEAGTGLDDAAAVLVWDKPCGCVPCDSGQIPTTAGIHDPNTGEIWARFPDALCNCATPDYVKVRYLAGDTACTWDEVVARFAAAEMTRTICQCDTAHNEFTRWNADRARINSNGLIFQSTEDSQNNPFGTREGHIQAWMRVMRNALYRGFAL